MLVEFLRDRRGNFTLLSALMAVSLVGIGGLTVDYGTGLYNRIRDQRVADLAAAAGARIYDETQSASSTTTAVDNIAAANGVSNSSISESIVNSPTGDGNKAVKVSVSSQVSLTFARLLQPRVSSVAVQATSYAEMKPGGAGCVIALSAGGTGVTINGGATVTTSNCAVASNQTINCHSSTNTITTQYAYYDTSALACGSNSPLYNNWIAPPSGDTLISSEVHTADPLAGSSEVLAVTGRLSTVESLTSPSAPTVGSGTNLAFSSSNNATSTLALTAQGCTGSYASSTWTVTCPPGSNVTFGTVSVASSTTLNWNVSGSSSNTYNFAQVSNGGGTMNFGPGTYNIAQGILTTNGSSSISTNFAAGTYNVGYPSSSTSCNSSYYYSICWGGGSITFAGPSAFVLAGGIYAKASTAVTLGSSGSTNSYKIGEAHDGYSLYVGNGADVILGDATGASDLFQMAGNIDSGGSSCFKLGAASQHDINGYMLTSGGSILGSGVYTLSKYISLGGSNGGTATCWGSSTGMTAIGVSIILGGTALDSSDCTPACAFYVGAGYSTVDLSAPTSGTTQGLAVIGPTSSSNTGTAVFAEGSSSTTISGAFYFPYGAISQSGSSSVGNGSGQCLELIASQVTLTGGSALASSCNIPGVGTSGTSGLVSIVQ